MKFGENSAHVISVDTNRIVVSYRFSGYSLMTPSDDNNSIIMYNYYAMSFDGMNSRVSEWSYCLNDSDGLLGSNPTLAGLSFDVIQFLPKKSTF